jgi:hypothetical protein
MTDEPSEGISFYVPSIFERSMQKEWLPSTVYVPTQALRCTNSTNVLTEYFFTSRVCEVQTHVQMGGDSAVTAGSQCCKYRMHVLVFRVALVCTQYARLYGRPLCKNFPKRLVARSVRVFPLMLPLTAIQLRCGNNKKETAEKSIRKQRCKTT